MSAALFDVASPEVAISGERVVGVCMVGHGPDCCRYVVMADGWRCAKHTALRVSIAARIAAGTLNAQGDNCSGLPLDPEVAS